MVFTVSIQAQGTGKIAGVVSDASTGEYLPGANVVIQGTNYGESTDRYGKYKFEQVPLGTYILVVTYIGYETYSTTFELINANYTVNIDIQLKITAVEIGDVVVSGLLQGQVKALNQQLNSKEIKNVLSREEMEKFPDMNTAEVLQRIPGVNIARDQGEGTFVYIRGTEPRLTSVTVDGQKLASSDTDKRITDLGIINSSQLASIEVTKALTPDMEANGIGGQVNLVSRSPFDYDKPQLKIDAGGGYEFQGNMPQYRFSGSYTGFIGDEKLFGYTLSTSYYQNNINGQSVSANWADLRITGGVILPLNINDFYLYNRKSKRDHFGVSGIMEYRPDKNNSFHLKLMYNLKLDDQEYNNLYYRLSGGRFANETAVTNARMDFTYINQVIQQRLVSAAVGGIHNFDELKLDYDLNFSFGDQIYPDSKPRVRSEWGMLTRTNFIIDLSNTDYPKFTPTNKEENFFADPSQWKTDAQEYKYRKINNYIYNGTVNVKLPYNLFGIPAELQAGAKYASEIKDRDAYVNRYFWRGTGELYMTEIATGDRNNNFLNDNYVFAPMSNSDNVRAFLDKYRNAGMSMEENIAESEGFGGNYTNTENLFSVYLMTTFNFGNLTVLTGVRNELANTNYAGNKIFLDNEGHFLYMEPDETKTNNNNIFPYLHLKYKFTPTTALRTAFTKSISRPNYFDLVPYFWIDPGGEIARGNPNLLPTIATNFDIMAEHYFQGIGVISIGGFYKILDNLIYERTYQQVGGEYDGYIFTEPSNAGSSKLWGFEINWQQQFTFLPGLLNGFGIYANYTKTKSKADLEFRDWTVLPGQAGDVGNLGISYEKYGLTARISFNFNSPVLIGVGTEPKYDRYTDSQRRLDFSGVYKIFSNLSIFLDLINITNQREKVYMGIQEKPTKIEFFGMSLRSGIKLDI